MSQLIISQENGKANHTDYNLMMKNACESLLKMKYKKNDAVGLRTDTDFRHEKAIENVLIKHKFILRDMNVCKKDINEWIINPSSCKLSIGEFIVQPCGTQDNPDFLVRTCYEKIIAIEAKSSKSEKPQYNSGGIHSDYLYIFCSQKINKTTLYWGRDIITMEQQNIIDSLINDQKNLEKIANEKLKNLDSNNRGIAYYTRPMITQKGDKSKTSYFKHHNRQICEKNVLNYF